MSNDLKKIRKFLVSRLGKFGLVLVERHDEQSANGWTVIINDTKKFESVCFLTSGRFESTADFTYAHAQSQDHLWRIALFDRLISDAMYVKYTRECVAEDGVFEREVKTEYLFGADVSKCKSWAEVMMKCAIATGDCR